MGTPSVFTNGGRGSTGCYAAQRLCLEMDLKHGENLPTKCQVKNLKKDVYSGTVLQLWCSERHLVQGRQYVFAE